MARPAKSTKFGRYLRHKQPHILELGYKASSKAFDTIGPVIEKFGSDRAGKVIGRVEHATKSAVFDCRMCGQCVLHSTGMTCPMTCPKSLRNGPCGGVRQNGNCEVFPEMRCVWVEAFEISQHMPTYGDELVGVNPPLNHQLSGQSAWITQLTGVDKQTPAGWVEISSVTIESKSATPVDKSNRDHLISESVAVPNRSSLD